MKRQCSETSLPPTPSSLDPIEISVARPSLQARIVAAMSKNGIAERRVLRFNACGAGWFALRSMESASSFKWCRMRCKDRLCGNCSYAKSRVVAENMQKAIGENITRMITLTIAHKEGEKLKDAVARLYKSFRRLRSYALWKERVSRGTAFTEIVRDEARKCWHVHLHVICQGLFLDQRDLSSLWLRATGDSIIVDIRLVRSRRNVVEYVVKYATKAGISESWTDEALEDYVAGAKGVHAIISFGEWRKLRLTARKPKGEWTFAGGEHEVSRKAKEGDVLAQVMIDALVVAKNSAIYGDEFEFLASDDPPSVGVREVKKAIQERLFR